MMSSICPSRLVSRPDGNWRTQLPALVYMDTLQRPSAALDWPGKVDTCSLCHVVQIRTEQSEEMQTNSRTILTRCSNGTDSLGSPGCRLQDRELLHLTESFQSGGTQRPVSRRGT